MKHADPTAKCVIFSQWTSFLDILRVRVLLVV
jgi:SNF2 family DNA or RNA helicase